MQHKLNLTLRGSRGLVAVLDVEATFVIVG